MNPVRFGLVGTDSPHAVSFTKLFADGTVAGGQVVAAWSGEPRDDFPLSSRGVANARTLAELGVALLDTPEQVAEQADVILIVEADARTHAGLFHRVAPAGKPVYVDTRFAMTSDEARSMLETAGTLVLAGSPKRFTPEFQRCLRAEPVLTADLTGPLPTQPGHPGLSWYGVHLVDLAVAALGPGCERVQLHDDVLTLTWPDGRQARLSGPAEWEPVTRGRLHSATGEQSFELVAGEPMLAGLLTALVAAAHDHHPTVPAPEILDIVAIIEAGNRCLAGAGPQPVRP
ncbi:gfo/Idh/MocA family oxidoreductase [Kribbella sp. NBC_00482]|uniref:gfo/Idh/MocA family oxidoreductase n=1 Tax=Kribbella sp. NBC_00482 TaxID=2975968 RepID=UPI002E185CD6